MPAVWIMSYLFMSLLGANAVLATAYYYFVSKPRKQARQNLFADNSRNLENHTLATSDQN